MWILKKDCFWNEIFLGLLYSKKNQDESKLKSEVNVTTIDDFEGDSASFFTSATFVITTTFSKRSIG